MAASSIMSVVGMSPSSEAGEAPAGSVSVNLDWVCIGAGAMEGCAVGADEKLC